MQKREVTEWLRTNSYKVYEHGRSKDRPLIHVPNFGEVWLKTGDELFFVGDFVFHNRIFNTTTRHRYLCRLGNLIPFPDLFTEDRIKYVYEKILVGEKETPLERDIRCINELASSLPKKDFWVSAYQFTNDVRPCHLYSFEDKTETYFGRGFGKQSAREVAWYLYRNLMKILPEGKTTCTAEEWEELPYNYVKYI